MIEKGPSMTGRRALLAGIGGLAAGSVLAAGRAEAGPLNPPGAPIATPGPEPRIAVNEENTPGAGSSIYRITEPGSYYLTGNVSGVSGRSGIIIAASNVSLDLMGFAVLGVPGSTTGVLTEGTCHNLVIRNGLVTGWGAGGIDLVTGGTGNGAMLHNVAARTNAGVGIRAGNCAVVRDCSALSHLNGTGIDVGSGSHVAGCTTSSNDIGGIRAGPGSTVHGCSARGNANSGIFGMESVMVCCCTSSENSSGISVDARSAVLDCVASSNFTHGILAQGGCSVVRCTADSNALHGIQVFFGSVVRDCTCLGNGQSLQGAGIMTNSEDCRIEGNTCTGNHIGIRATAGGNILMRNMVSGSTLHNWDIAANNSCLVAVASLTSAFAGNTGGALLVSMDPGVNYTF